MYSGKMRSSQTSCTWCFGSLWKGQDKKEYKKT